MNGEREREEPRVLAGYELVSLLGKGGMAKVHLARKVGQEGYVALKSVRPDDVDDDAVTVTLHDEARVLAHIRHPNVVPLLDVLRVEENLLLVMPFVRGASLAELMVGTSRKSTKLSPGVVSAIIQDLLAGLGAAHEARGSQGEPLHVVHRDVSPQNVMVGDDGITRVLDFGIAKAVGRSAKTTRDGALKGKVAYMAPEQVHGEDVDARADLYAVGVLFWEMLALERLFAGANDADTLRRVLMAHVPTLATFRHDLPAEIDSFFTKALARKKDIRFGSAEAMAIELERLLPRAPHSDVVAALQVCEAEMRRRDPPAPTAKPVSIPPTVSVRPSGSTTHGGVSRSTPSARGGAWAALLGLVGLVLFGGIGVALAVRSSASPKTASAATSLSTALVATSVGASPTPSATSLALPSPTSLSSALAGEASKFEPSPAPSASATPTPSSQPTISKRAPPRTLPPNCAVPYTVDEHGRKKYRTECLP